MNQYLMLAIGLIVEVAHAKKHRRSTIVVNAIQAITISSISLPFLALENAPLAWVALTLEYQCQTHHHHLLHHQY
uniref:Uncharacterized protein n=1 Tax=Medicago truncatula TaxID=3880 RepID=I3SPR5_MEDTR|nr:unknown [Medicago truncatula]